MSEKASSPAGVELSSSPGQGGRAVRPLTSDERISFFIVSLYLVLFCCSVFIYWDHLVLKILGVTAAAAGLFLFTASFFNTEAPERSRSRHPVHSYLLNLMLILALLLVIRYAGGVVGNSITGAVIIYGGLLATLVIFRKAVMQIISTLLAVLFMYVTIANWNGIVVGRMTFKDAIRECGQVVFRLGPIREVRNLLVTGNYMGYLTRIDYRNPQLNIKASHIVAGTQDDELLKAERLLAFVSSEIEYISDPTDGVEYPKDPVVTLAAGAGDCEDQTLLLCSMLETVGVKSFIVFTPDHVFALVRFEKEHRELPARPYLLVEGEPCYALDPSIPAARIGDCTAQAATVQHVFDVRRKLPLRFTVLSD